MKQLALLPLLALLACSSSPSFGIDQNRVLDCENSEIEVLAGFSGPGTQMERVDDRVTMVIDVGNNSRNDIVVNAIRVEQVQMETAPYRLENGYRDFKVTVVEGEDHQFEIPMNGRGARDPSGRRMQSDQLQIAVSVYLAGGDTYRCHFLVPAPL